jgi:hypothetical protein
MNSIRLGFIVASLSVAVGCAFIGAPERASDTQNVNAISDDIAALTMTQSNAMHASNPMARTVLPRQDQLPQE